MMEIKFYQAADGEWLARAFEPGHSQIVFYFTGHDRDAVQAEADAFWQSHIEPKRKQREQTAANRIEARRKAAERKSAKQDEAA